MGTTSSLADAFNVEQTPRGPKCSVAFLRQTLNETDAATLDRLLADDLVSHAKISRALRVVGHRVAGNTIGRHRRGECRCGL